MLSVWLDLLQQRFSGTSKLIYVSIEVQQSFLTEIKDNSCNQKDFDERSEERKKEQKTEMM